MAKISIIATPTFQMPVPVPVPGAKAVEVPFTFKHRTKDELAAFAASRQDRTDTDTFMEMVVGWGFEDEFNRENVDLLLQNRIGTALAVYQTYISELTKFRAAT